MGEEQSLNWVQRRKRTEANLAADLDYIWRDVKQALEDATRSFVSEYGGDAEAIVINSHRFRVRCTTSPDPRTRRPTEIDIAFDKDKRELKAESADPAIQHLPKTFRICADTNTAFICEPNKQDRITPDRFSEIVLDPVFFPKKPQLGWVNTRIT